MRTAVLSALGLAWALVAAAPVSAQKVAGEYELKAAFLHNFAKFVVWPDSRLPESQPIVLGLVGDHPFGRTIDVINGKTANGHRVVVQRLRWNDDLSRNHILFISASELSRLPQILRSIEGQPVLTVGDFDRFAERGGMIGLSTTNGRLQLEINVAAASVADLKVSSKLLQVARVVSAYAEVNR